MSYYNNETWFDRLKFRLFGELRIFAWIFGIAILALILWWSFAGYVVLHFIEKYW